MNFNWQVACRAAVVGGDQTEMLEAFEKGQLSGKQVVELGDIVSGKTPVKQDEGRNQPGKIIYYKNNTGLAI